jgi:hypothetical protein
MTTADALENSLFFLRSNLYSIEPYVKNLQSPIKSVSPTARSYLSKAQIEAIEKSFFIRGQKIKTIYDSILQSYAKQELENYLYEFEKVRENYFQREIIFDHYVDACNTRSEQIVDPEDDEVSNVPIDKNLGSLLRGCDIIAEQCMKPLEKLGIEVPITICYADRGQGYSILKSGIYLWDDELNPAAIIKCVRSSIPSPRLTSLCHEVGHQVAHITNWEDELSELIFNTVYEQSKSEALAMIWKHWHKEIAADTYGICWGHFASAIGCAEVVCGSRDRVFYFRPMAVHPQNYLRVLMHTTICKIVLGPDGPWTDFEKAWEILYPAIQNHKDYWLIKESKEILDEICKAILFTKMKSFNNQALTEFVPFNINSLIRIKNLLNKEFSDFIMDADIVSNPMDTIVAFRFIHFFGGRSNKWIISKMTRWLGSLKRSNE